MKYGVPSLPSTDPVIYKRIFFSFFGVVIVVLGVFYYMYIVFNYRSKYNIDLLEDKNSFVRLLYFKEESF